MSLTEQNNPSGFLIPMNELQLEQYLSSLPMSTFRYYDTIGSTNEEALAWASQGAPDLSLIVADEQTRGRGRLDRTWFTPPHSALAMSLILRPTTIEHAHPARTTGLLALSLAESLLKLGLVPQIKWPNDVLLSGRKVAGILVESSWLGDELDALVLGMGVNVLDASVPPPDQLAFPATSIQTELGYAMERLELLRDILLKVMDWRPNIGTDAFLKSWEGSLAYRGQQVQVQSESHETIIGEVLGLDTEGGLCLQDEHGKSVTVQFGEVHLRPLT
jgi:BirA family biotin operon repressor/biotin-[acetyl-CoA-carboxylase] ligase